MPACTFFGHRDCPDGIQEQIYQAVKMLAVKQSADQFYVGNQGKFDLYAQAALQRIVREYPHIKAEVVLAYMPRTGRENEYQLPTVFPAEMAGVPARFAIVRRNRWMLQRSEFVISYVAHPWGGAATFQKMAVRQGKTVLNLCDAKEKTFSHRS